MDEYVKGGILWLIVVSIIGYLLCSLFSWSFNWNNWNLFSEIIGYIFLIIDTTIISEIKRHKDEDF